METFEKEILSILKNIQQSISGLEQGQEEMRSDIKDLQQGQEKMRSDIKDLQQGK